MTYRNMTRGRQFTHRGNVYRVTENMDSNGRFLAIWVGRGQYRDFVTYRGYVNNGDFRLDNSLFRLTSTGRVRRVHAATGVLGLDRASQDYLDAVFA